jgi:hypothetical protein
MAVSHIIHVCLRSFVDGAAILSGGLGRVERRIGVAQQQVDVPVGAILRRGATGIACWLYARPPGSR